MQLWEVEYRAIAKGICEDIPHYSHLYNGKRNAFERKWIYKLESATSTGLDYKKHIAFDEIIGEFRIHELCERFTHDDYLYMLEVINYVNFIELKNTDTYSRLGLPTAIGETLYYTVRQFVP